MRPATPDKGTRFPNPDPVDQIMSLIAGSSGLPSVADLAQGFFAGWSPMEGVRGLAVGADPTGSVLLDTASWRHRASWLVFTPETTSHRSEPRWIDMDDRWPEVAAAFGGPDGPVMQVVAGTDAMPGGQPWNREGYGFVAQDCAGWLMAPVCGRGEMKFVLMIGLEGAPSEYPRVRQSLERLLREMGPVATVWSEALVLSHRLRQADDENKALARLNTLQGQFVAMANHEFKAPLTSITAYADVLGEQLKETSFAHADEFLGVIRNEAGRLLRMVNRILDFTKMEHGARLPEQLPMDMEPLVRETVQSLEPKITRKELTVSIQVKNGLPRASIDPDLIRQVLVNLIHNAVKFTAAGGRILIQLQERESAIEVSVVDNGPGIPDRDIRRIFREFYRADGPTARQMGTGLGLSIARHIIQLHGGHIEVARRPEGGSVFRFLVPKEMESLASLTEVLDLPIDQVKGSRLMENLLSLLADMTGSRTVVMFLRDGKGALVPVGALGLDLRVAQPRPLIENDRWTRFLERGETVTDPGPLTGEFKWCPRERPADRCRMYAPIGDGEAALGFVVLGRRRGLETYDQADLVQLSVLTGIVSSGLAHLDTDTTWAAAAIRLLLRVRRNGVPTATPQALTMTRNLGQRLGLSAPEIKRLQLATVLHDAGMAQVEEEIVLGESDLTVDERDEVNTHVEQVVDLLGPLLPGMAVEKIIRHHHEWMDGSGYPDGMKGEDIPLGSRLLAVIDTWFALTSSRPFRQGLSPEDALEEIRLHGGTQFDGRIIDALTVILQEEGLLSANQATMGPA